MKRKALTSLLILWLAASALTAIELTSLTKADPYIPPEEAPSGYRIRSDGTYNASNLRRDGNVYTLTGDIQGTIVIERDGVVLDGAGYTLQGDGSSHGIWLQDRRNVTIKNLNIRNFGHGIRFSHYVANWYAGETNPNYTTDCTIEACKITNSGHGISFYYSFNCSAIGNYIANNTYGVYLYGSDNIFRNNRIEQNKYNFWDIDEKINDVDSSNTINGKPVYYWVKRHNMTVPDNAALVILKHCSGIRVQNLNLTGNAVGVSLYYTSNSEIFGNNITDNYWRGIAVWWSHNNSIIGNQITNTEYDGIEVYDSDNNTISHNLIKANKIGIYHRTAPTNAVISSNQIIGNEHASMSGGVINSTITNNYIFGNGGSGISAGTNCIITGNNITQNKGVGITFRSNNLLMGNYISKNQRGIQVYHGTGNTITTNSIVENEGCGIHLQGPAENNFVYHNNFIGNNNSGTQASVQGFWVFPGDERYSTSDGLPQHIAGPVNSWDNGAEGNYWSDYNSRYPNAQKVENSTVGNTSYYIDDNNQDNHPLLTPLEFAALELPSLEPPQEDDPTAIESPTFPALIIACIASVATASIGLLIYFKRRKR